MAERRIRKRDLAAVLRSLTQQPRAADAYRLAKQVRELSVMEVGRCLLALETAGKARRVEDGGDNQLASTFEAAVSV